MKLILYQATMAITEIDFVPGPFRCQIEQQHLDFAVAMGSAQKPGVFRLARISRVNKLDWNSTIDGIVGFLAEHL